MIDTDKHLSNQIFLLKELSVDPFRNAFIFPKKENEYTIAQIELHGISIDANANYICEIDLTTLPFTAFYDETDFLNRVTRKSWGKPILLYKENVVYYPIEDATYKVGTVIENQFLVRNNFYCFKFFNFLKTQEHQENSAFYFVDYLNWDTYHLVLTSLKKDGKIEILLPKKGVNIKSDVKLHSAVNEFISAFNETNRHFPKFIKTELIASMSKIDKSKRLELLLSHLNDIIYTASQNFEIYINDLSLENLKKDFIEHKNKYFLQLRDVLSKLTNQIAGLPIAIGASVFSTYKVNDSNSTLIIILGVFFLYSSYTIFLLKLQKDDVDDINLSFLSDFDKIKGSEFFKKFPEELSDFKKAKRNLDLRIQSLISAINVYFIFSSVSTIAFTLYVENQLKISSSGMVWTAIVIGISFFSIYLLNQSILKKQND